MKYPFKILISFSALLLLSACFNTRNFEVPAVNTFQPESWQSDDVIELTAFNSISASAQLRALLQEALANNLDLEVAYQRLEAVRQQARAAKGSRLPTLDASISEQDQRSFGLDTEIATATLALSWEVDIWGRVASLSQQVAATAAEQEALFKGAQYSLAAQVVQLWFDIIEAKQQLALATARTKSLQASLDIIEDGFNSGIRQALDVYSARAELANNRVSLAQRERTLSTFVRQFTVLLGRAPSLTLEVPAQLPEFTAQIPSQLSSTLINRRPDMQAALYALEAQHNAVNVAFTNRLPRFSFTANSAAVGTSLSDVLSGGDTTWSLLGGITAPLFQGGQLAAEQKRQRFLLNAQIASYKSTALVAFQEIEQTLHSEQQLVAQAVAAAEAAQISDLAQAQALEQYISGISNINTWLQAQRNAFDRNSALLQIQASKLKNRVDVYLALGGNFGSEQSQ